MTQGDKTPSRVRCRRLLYKPSTWGKPVHSSDSDSEIDKRLQEWAREQNNKSEDSP